MSAGVHGRAGKPAKASQCQRAQSADNGPLFKVQTKLPNADVRLRCEAVVCRTVRCLACFQFMQEWDYLTGAMPQMPRA